MVEPHSSNFRVITTNFLGVRIFKKFTVITIRLNPGKCILKKSELNKQEGFVLSQTTKLPLIKTFRQQIKNYISSLFH